MRTRRITILVASVAGITCQGCQAVRNGWLDPTTVGTFDRSTTWEIRSSLTLEDQPMGIPGETPPGPADQELKVLEYPLSAGDVVLVEINELRERQIPYQAQAQISPSGYLNIPAVGRVYAVGLTAPELEVAIARTLREREILMEPEVTVNTQTLQKATYSVFGIGVSASDNSPLRAGTFPIRRPDLRVLEAINLVGGLNEFVSDVYIFRYDDPDGGASPAPPADKKIDQPPAAPEAKQVPDDAQEQLLEAVAPPGTKPTTGIGEPTAKDRADVESLIRQLEPDPSVPYLWVDDQWVANPKYVRTEPAIPVPVGAGSDDLAAVNWSRVAGDSQYRVIRIPADSLRSGDPEQNIYVRAGDILRIVSGEIGVYYVMGQVNRVGAFSFNAEPVTLKAAIANAGGLGGLAWPDRCTVYRRVGPREQVIQVNLDRIFAGLDEDFFIKRGDIVNVGTHPFAPFLQRIRAWTLPNPVNNVGYSFTYARNFADIDSYAVKQNPANEPDRFPNLFP